MSNEAQGLVRNLAMEAPHKPILMAYANYADEAGYCWPGVETIAFDSGYSVPTVVRVRRQLVKANWMRSKRQFGTSATTRLNLPKLAAEGVDRGDRTKVRPEFEFESDETAGQTRTDHSDLNEKTAGQTRTDHSDLNEKTAGQTRTDHSDLNSQITVISTRDHSDHLSIRDSSVDPSVEASKERAREKASPTPDPAEWALRLVADLDFGRFRRPTVKRARSMAHKIETAVASGLSEREIRRHCRAALNEATSNGAAYLDGALDPDHLPLPTVARAKCQPKEARPSADATQASIEGETLGHRQAMEQIRQVLLTGRDRASGA